MTTSDKSSVEEFGSLADVLASMSGKQVNKIIVDDDKLEQRTDWMDASNSTPSQNLSKTSLNSILGP